MANPKWDNGSVEDKLEMLRTEMDRIFSIVNGVSQAIGEDMEKIRIRLRPVETTLSEVAKAVEDLEETTQMAGKKKARNKKI